MHKAPIAHLIQRRDELQRAVVRALENLQILLRRPPARAQIRVHARKNLVLKRALQQQLDDALGLRKHLRRGGRVEWGRSQSHNQAYTKIRNDHIFS